MSSPVADAATAIVVAGDDTTRALLRGLLRLHHFQVDGEAEGASRALELLRDHRPGLLVIDADLAEGSWVALVGEARGILPKLRVILVASASRPPAPPSDAARRPDVVLFRPFRLSRFAEALTPGGLGSGEGST